MNKKNIILSNTAQSSQPPSATDFEHITREMYKKNMELADSNKSLSLLRKIDTLVLDSPDGLNKLCQDISKNIAQSDDYPFVAIFTQAGTKNKSLQLAAVSGVSFTNIDNRIKATLKISRTNPWFIKDEKSLHVDISQHSYESISHYTKVPLDLVKKILVQTTTKSVYLTKLSARGKLVGLMVVGFHLGGQETSLDTIRRNKELIDHLSEAVGVAVDNKLLFEENKRVLNRLKKTNKKLVELDETKDEFISMASHQLRTPLTSVKGYMSMVLEGDAGKLSKQQRELLNQAYISSQRMVYLIADLLNVSRLKSGKLVIDKSPVNLAKIVETEIKQLTEMAKSKGLKLIYTKPKAFPEVELDETKTRQVIMNFVDNSIYYTKSGGKIEIILGEDARSIYFQVRDNGLGVPKNEQPKIFTKFYRASNARKARPDGTGLGLFMAKKIIDAQGGSIIFESAQNQGSTFGFRFLKK